MQINKYGGQYLIDNHTTNSNMSSFKPPIPSQRQFTNNTVSWQTQQQQQHYPGNDYGTNGNSFDPSAAAG